MRSYEYKRQGGKLIGVSFNYTNKIFSGIKIYGDFFIFPEEEIERLEKTIEGKTYSEISKSIEDFFSSGIRFYGITREDLLELFKGAISEK
ncbi:MAG: hypothetical protein GYA60_07145 [Candidatus Methanofastidiosa archaeon]|jgi:hypothetical protein|nr:hypothetical protein [Candidatus Methanofastidiosa archaeon]